VDRPPWIFFLAAFCCALALPSSSVRAQENDCGLEPPGSVDAPPVERKPFEQPFRKGEPPLVRREISASAPVGRAALTPLRVRTGALSGKSVYISAGHGFTWTESLNAWRTQRGNTNQIVEDLVSIETTNQFLVPMLMALGAHVVTVRELDLNPRMAIVDNDDLAGGYSESGPPQLFAYSSLAGWGAPNLPMASGTNPFALGRNRLMNASPTATASATWLPVIPSDGQYNVYVSYTSFSARVGDAHYVVKHAGGESHFRVNQRRHGATWVFLGQFYFRAGQNPDAGSVTALNDSADAGNVSLDAVRFGGGAGLIDRGRGVSGRPRFEECARYHAQWSGAPPSVYHYTSTDHDDDVGTRSRFTAWDHEDGEDAVYFAWHTNAPNPALGTETYVYGPNPPDGTYHFTGVPGSDRLAQWVHGELIRDLRARWLPSWRDRGIRSAYFGELNPSHNPETPAILMEVAFHDTPSDAEHLKEPGFRYLAARAIAHGMVRYFAEREGTEATFAPEPPGAVSAVNAGDGSVVVRWTPASPDSGGGVADGYRVYQSSDGLGWDEGTESVDPWMSLSLEPGSIRYFRVAAFNGGGESFPSELVGVRAAATSAPVLVVNGYRRLDKGLGLFEDLTAYALGRPLRILIARMNDGSYVRHHADGIAFGNLAFDSVLDDALTVGDVALAGYAAVDWIAGRGGRGGQPPPPAQQAPLRAYLDAGGSLLLTGSHVASGLAGGDPESQAFLQQVLHAAAGAPSSALRVDGAADQFLAGWTSVVLDDGTMGGYGAGPTDSLFTAAGSVPVATYAGSADAAGLSFSGESKVVLLAFPLETVTSATQRTEAMQRILGFFGLVDMADPRRNNTKGPGALATVPQSPLSVQLASGCSSGGGTVAVGIPIAVLWLMARRRGRG